jgi:diadenosine tetraphosphate (Ap4A) HIT family hydrolase
LEYDRDNAAPQRRKQLERRIRAMLEELYAQRPKLIQLLEEHAMRADWRHEPENYACPFCALVSPDFPGDDIHAPSDVFLRTERATAFIAPKWWPNNVGHALVIPNAHHENIYDLPAEHGHAVHDAVKEVAIAIRATYGVRACRRGSTTSRPATRTSGTCTYTSFLDTRVTSSTARSRCPSSRRGPSARPMPSGCAIT